MKFICALVVFVVVVSTASAGKRRRCFPVDSPALTCGEHERYEKCSTLCGEKTCDRRTDLYCGAGCQERCLCEEGYIRDANNKCILEEDCPAPTCANAHESYTTCGTACPVTCENKDKPITCTKQCVQGCFCEDGYVRNAKGECVLPAECPVLPPSPQCGRNEEYSICDANSCQLSCSILNMNVACRPICTAGCICKEGYIKDDNNVCILVEDCPATTPVCTKAHESYNTCGTACPLTCQNKDSPPLFCTANCVADCFCESGYVRDNKGECVLLAQCPATLPQCGLNEEYSECGAHGCLSTCSEPDRLTYCDPAPGCSPGCVCKEGFIRDNNGACIVPSQCPTTASVGISIRDTSS